MARRRAEAVVAVRGATDETASWWRAFRRRKAQAQAQATGQPPELCGLSIAEAAPDGLWEADLLHTMVFGQPNEVRMLQALRAEGGMCAEVVALKDGEVVGHLGAADLVAPVGWVTLLPAPTRADVDADAVRREMVRAVLRLAAQRGARMALTTGDPEFYRTCGFNHAAGLMLDTPFPAFSTGLFPLTSHPETPRAPTAVTYPGAILRA